jgi:hypothetical protein
MCLYVYDYMQEYYINLVRDAQAGRLPSIAKKTPSAHRSAQGGRHSHDYVYPPGKEYLGNQLSVFYVAPKQRYLYSTPKVRMHVILLHFHILMNTSVYILARPCVCL